MNPAPADFPHRAKLPHVPPPWINLGSLFFVPICCTPRGRNQLCEPTTADVIFESAEFRQHRSDWHVTLLLLMLDRLHMLVAFPLGQDMAKVITDWKSLLARRTGVAWQRDFFDHRIRSGASWEQKADYIRLNPVRASLVARPEDWKFVWEPKDVGPGRSALPKTPPC